MMKRLGVSSGVTEKVFLLMSAPSVQEKFSDRDHSDVALNILTPSCI